MHPHELCCCGHAYADHQHGPCSFALTRGRTCSCRRFVWIAAAPEMLEALEMVLDAKRDGDISNEEYKSLFAAVEAAIRKARGE